MYPIKKQNKTPQYHQQNFVFLDVSYENTMDFHFLDVSYDEKERRYFGPILVMKLLGAQVPTAGQTSFTIQETGKVAILCRSGSNLFTGKSHRRFDH